MIGSNKNTSIEKPSQSDNINVYIWAQYESLFKPSKYTGNEVGLDIYTQSTKLWEYGMNVNYKIALLPRYLADYIIVHELCHLGEFNHPKNFWKLVSVAVSNYKEIKLNTSPNSIWLFNESCYNTECLD